MALLGYSPPDSDVYVLPSGQAFTARGNFYDYLDGGTTYPCRSLLTISRGRKRNAAPGTLPKGAPDARVIMMNPGASAPFDPSYSPPVVNLASGIGQFLALVPTIPDVTQIQIMRLMEAKGWSEVRIFNLCDAREASSTTFLAKIRTLPMALSLFSPDRQAEWNAISGSRHLPTILAWGRDRRLLRFAQCAQRLVLGSPLYFHAPPKGTKVPLYYHPLPRYGDPEVWLQAMVNAIP